jgi:hypothetical protein
MNVSKLTRCFLSLLASALLTLWLALPAITSGNADSAPRRQNKFASGLDAQRQAAMEKLYAELQAGAAFSLEEAKILRSFAAGNVLTELEADVVISRALYDYYVAGKALNRQQQALLDQYTAYVSRRSHDLADLKLQLLKQRQDAAITAPHHVTVAPANDTCAGAEVIPPAGPFPYLTSVTADITDATTTGDPPLPSCQDSLSRSIWYTFTPSATANYTISSCADAPTATTVDDTVMAIYTASNNCSGFTELPNSGVTNGCDDDSCASEAFQAAINTRLNAGTQYYIVVWSFGTAPPTAGNTAVQLRVTLNSTPANDTCAAATALQLNTPVAGTTVGASNDYQLSGSACFTGIGQTASIASGRDVVYSFIAPNAGSFSFKVTGYNPASDLVLYAASSCPTGTPPITVSTCLAAANRSSTSSAEEVMCLALTAGQQIFLFVDESTLTDGSPFTIEATKCFSEVEPNDIPATANPGVIGLEGSINSGSDTDFYSLGTPAAGSRIFAIVDGGASNSSDFDMRVTTANDTLEYDDADNDLSFGGLSANVAGTIATGAPLYLRVNNFSAIASEPYRLYYSVRPPITEAVAETEPNDTILQANSSPSNYITGTLSGPAPSTDTDIFGFTATAGEIIYIGLDADPTRDGTPINAALALLNSVGAVLVSVNDSGSTSSTTSGAGSLTSTTPASPAETLIYRVMTSGTYYARITIGTSANDSTGAGDYLLSISRLTSPTAAKFDNEQAIPVARATRQASGVAIRWETGYEIDNLGFNIYREENGKRVQVNQQMIAGSALMIGAGMALSTGKSYSWFDSSTANVETQYWIEDVDLNGQSTWHGPVKISETTGTQTDKTTKSLTLADVGNPPQSALTVPVERRASVHILSQSSVSQTATTHGVSQFPTLRQASLADQPAVKVSVKSEGLYRVSLADLFAAGFPADVDPKTLQVFADGREQPIMITTPAGKFDSTATIEFYGIGIDSSATDSHVYWITAGKQPSQRMQRIAAPAHQVSGGSFLQTVESKERTLYFAALRNGDKENFFGAVVGASPVDQLLTLQHVDRSPGSATLEVALQGITLVTHSVDVQINGVSAGTLNFSGQEEGIVQLNIPQSILWEGANAVRLITRGGSSDISLIDYIRLSHWHSYIADNDQLRFSTAGKASVTIEGFSNAAIRVFDVTNVNAPQEIIGSVRQAKTGYSVSCIPPLAGQRTLLALTDARMKSVAEIKANQPSNWRQPLAGADLLIITRRDFFTQLEPLKDLRSSQGFTVALVDIEDIYDEFSYGNKSPEAIREFLIYAKGNWLRAPRYVILAGDASFDAKNYLGFGNNDLVPTKLLDTSSMETASDDWFADFNDDGLSEVAIGRLPIRTATEASIVVKKLMAYDQFPQSQKVLLVADADEQMDFAVPSRELRQLIPDELLTQEIYRSLVDAPAARAQLLAALNRGAKIVNYTGHANVDSWRGNLLTSADAKTLKNGKNLSLFIMMSCLNGYFHDAQQESLAESLLKAEQGGAIAVWAASGITQPGDQALLNSEAFKLLLHSLQSLTLGDIVQQAKAAAENKDVRRTWILLGDPTVRMK